MTKHWYDYEEESGDRLIFPRNHLRNIIKSTELFSFPFELVERNSGKPYDVYVFNECELLVVGGGSHCHVGEEFGKYNEGIVFFCDETEKEEVIKQIRKVA